jgi:hypothetical protein
VDRDARAASGVDHHEQAENGKEMPAEKFSPRFSEGYSDAYSMTDMLQDIRVVEFSDGCSAAFCGRLFARLGANVLLVERPRSGSAVRWEPPFLDDLPGVERGGLFMYTASGKRSLTLDPISPDGAAILRRLLERADVLIDDRELSAGSAPAEDVNPRLVRLAFRHFTLGGPYEKWLATELQLAALGGWAAQLGQPRRTPLVSNSRTMTAFVPRRGRRNRGTGGRARRARTRPRPAYRRGRAGSDGLHHALQ